MGHTHRSASHLWELALRKLFPKRASLSRRRNSEPDRPQSSHSDDYADGFYKYSQELLEEENQRLEEMRLRSSNSTAASYASALTAPGRPTLPYTVSSADWNIFSSFFQRLDEVDDDTLAEWLGNVLSVYVRVYTVSKIVVMAFLHYGVDLEDIPDDILSHVKRAEELVTSNSITALIDITENLYYALYSRLIMEIASADLCSTFNLDVRRLATNSFVLPEPKQLAKILLVCKEVLDDPTVCTNINRDIIVEYQNRFIRRSVDKVIGVGFILEDLIGYRRYALSIANDKSSEFHEKWSKPRMMYQMPPAEILTVQSEKYLTFIPKMAAQQAVPALDLPFVDPHITEHEIIMDNREATRAMLESKCIGDSRRKHLRRRLIDLVRERRCICYSICTCAMGCTMDVERHCPCSERLLSLMVAKRRRSVGPLPFGPRCGALARAIFLGMVSIRSDADDMELVADMDRALLIFTEEIKKQRGIY